MSTPPPRILALYPQDHGPSLVLSRLIGALSAQGATVEPLAVPVPRMLGTDGSPPTLAELKAGLHSLAESMGAALTGGDQSSPNATHAIEAALSSVSGEIAAVVCTDARLGEQVLPLAAKTWPDALRIAVEGDFHIAPEWGRTPFDAIVTPHPTLGAELEPIRQGRARLYAGGPIALAEGADKTLGEDKPMVVMSFSRLDPSQVDPLLFQLSLTDPDRYHLLFLPSGRSSIDDLVRNRAGGYGLTGKRPKAGSDPEPWIRGADLLVGHPAPAESAAAVSAKVPQVLCTTSTELSNGDTFLVQHDLALHAASALTIAVQVDNALPGGAGRVTLEEALERLETDGAAGAAGCVLRAVRDGRSSSVQSPHTVSGEDDELEDIGQVSTHREPGVMDERARKAYLKEIIVQQRDMKRQIDRAREGVDTWSNRRRLAERAGNERLEREARMRVEGLQRVLDRLVRQERDTQALRERFASGQPLSAGDRAAASQLMSPEASATMDRLSRATQKGAFERLEIEDALNELKRRMGRDE